MLGKTRKAAPTGSAPEQARYALEAELGAGGMGVVYRGFDHHAQRPIAYKRLRVHNEAARGRAAALFQREFDTLTQLTHPNIVEVYDYGFDAEGPYYVMEFLSGSDLTNLAPLPVQLTLSHKSLRNGRGVI